jgi:hypothetical protein
MLTATENFRLSNVLKHEYEPSLGYCRETVVINNAAANLKIGTVLGVVTATGKYKVCVQTATDGSQNAAAVLMEDKTIANSTDTKVLALVRGPAIVSKSGLVFDASFDQEAKRAAAYASLAAKGIVASDAV